MRLLAAIGAALVAVVPKRPAPLDADQLDELARRARLNGLAATRRAERGAAFDELASDRPRWLGRRPGWFERRRIQ
jgi:hypothetical protein